MREVQEVKAGKGYDEVCLVLPAGSNIPKSQRVRQPIRVGDVRAVTLNLNMIGKTGKRAVYNVPARVHEVHLILPSGAGKRVEDRDVQTIRLKQTDGVVIVQIPPAEPTDPKSLVDLDSVIAVLQQMEGFQAYLNTTSIDTAVLQETEGDDGLPGQLRRYMNAGGKLYDLAVRAVRQASRTQSIDRATREEWARSLADKLSEIAGRKNRRLKQRKLPGIDRLFKIGRK